jgi:cytochrome c oxidase cbb3-type subunit 3
LPVFRIARMIPTLRFLAALGLSLLAMPLAAAPDGVRLYQQHCAACHGSGGSGGVGVPLALPDFLVTVDDAYLERTIRLGRPGRVMPAFRALANDEVRAIVSHVRGFAGDSKPKPVEARAGDAARGARLYAGHCAACHGANGEGGHGTGVTFSRPRDYPVLAPALNNPGYLASASDAVIKATLVHGRQGTPMQSFLKQGLRERDLDDIVAHVRGFERALTPAKPPAAAAEAAIIVRESSYGLEETVEKLKTAFNVAGMQVVASEYFGQRFVSPDRIDKRRKFVDGCDFSFVNKALAIDPRVGLFMPCRVTVEALGDKVRVLAMNPKFMSTLFNNRELEELCVRMAEIYLALIEEAVL